MSGVNVGSQSVYFNYHKPLTGDIFGRSQYLVRRAGVLNGLGVTKVSNTSVTIASGIFNISDGTHTVTINKASTHDLTVSNTNNYVVIRYTYSENENWYAKFLNLSSPSSTDVILARLNWSGGTLTSIDTTAKTDGNRVLDSEVYVTANSYNSYLKDLIQAGTFGNTASGNLWLNLIDNAWFDDSSYPPVEEMLGGMLPVLSFPNDVNRYMYFLLKSGSPVDINFKLKCVANSTNTGAFVIQIDYLTLSDGQTGMDVLSFSNYTSQAFTAPGAINVYKEYTSTTLKIPSAAMTVPDKLILCRIFRDYAAVADTFTGAIKFLQIVPAIT